MLAEKNFLPRMCASASRAKSQQGCRRYAWYAAFLVSFLEPFVISLSREFDVSERVWIQEGVLVDEIELK
jgi:hypothetical protein